MKHDVAGTITKLKFRLNAAGYAQIAEVDFDNTYASVGKKSSLRIVIRLAAHHKLQLAQLDFEAAFLNTDLSEEKAIYMEQSPGLRQMPAKFGSSRKHCMA